MPFESVLKKIFESGLESFNKADYEQLSEIIIKHAQLISPAIDLPKIKAPAVHLKNFKDIVEYWAATNEKFENRITKFEYLEIGKISKVRCYYEKVNLILDAEIFFDTYGKITKMVNHLVKE